MRSISEDSFAGADPEGSQYMVALSQEIVQADEAQLAPEFEPGQRVVYQAPDGSLMDASVGELNASHWSAQLLRTLSHYLASLLKHANTISRDPDNLTYLDVAVGTFIFGNLQRSADADCCRVGLTQTFPLHGWVISCRG